MAQPQTNDIISFTYHFRFDDETEKTFAVRLNAVSLELVSERPAEPPEWTRLEYHACDHCPLAGAASHCPIAVNFSQLIAAFKDDVSFEHTVVTVEAPERTYVKDTTLQKGLSSIIGIYMVTSNCPVMDELRPMTRFHLPFATATETLFRAVSAYLTAQFFVMREGKKPDWELNNLVGIYKRVSEVNKGMSRRLSHASEKDANVNAVIILHSFGDSIPYFIEQGLDEIRYLFAKFLRGDSSPSA